MPVFRGSPWQLGHGQMGYGLSVLFRSVARAVMPMVKSGANQCTKSELDLFSVPPTHDQVSLEKGHWIDHQPVSSVSDWGPITFLSPGTEDYVDLSKTILVVRAKVTKADGANLDADEKVGVVKNFLHTLFKQVDVFLKEKQVTQATRTYSYRAYLETLLNYGPAAKKSQLTAALFYKDTAGKMDTADPRLAANKVSEQGISLVEKAEPLNWLVLYSVTCLEASVSY